MRRQLPIKGGRFPNYSALEKRIERAVERTAEKFDCSKSFVVATLLADAFGIPIDDRADKPRKYNGKKR